MTVNAPWLGLGKSEPKDRSRINTLDFLLMSIGSALAAYSAGMAVSSPEVGFYFMRLIAVGTLFSWLVRRFLGNSWLVRTDGILYTALGIFVVSQTVMLNEILPGDPFPRPLAAAAYLGWMLALGSFVTWRDGTLLFQAVPAIALFGLIGCYDTFRDVTFAFFGFLLCLATLFSRANGRDMLRWAAESGFLLRAERKRGEAAEVKRDQALYERLRTGPWRWVAGPEWALASAMIVVLLSVLGAPVVQKSVETVAGNFRVQVAQVNPGRTNSPAAFQEPNDVRIGRGPNTSLTRTPVFEFSTQGRERYLRTGIYDRYAGGQWSQAPDIGFTAGPQYIREPLEVEFSIRRLVPSPNVPVPGDIAEWRSPGELRRMPEGTFRSSDPAANREYVGVAYEANPQFAAEDAVELSSMNSMRSVANIPPEVADFARKAVEGAQTDREKADRLMQAIGRQVKYNIRAGATPDDKDPVSYFLFEQKEGYCDVFASAMVLMARSVGLPARYVQGFLPDEQDAAGRYVVLEKDYHAWAEILFVDTGWTIFDATGLAEAVEGGERGQEADPRPWWEKEPYKQILNNGIIIVGILAAGFLGWSQLRGNSVGPRRNEFDRAYGSFVAMLERARGKRRRQWETPDEFLGSAAASLGEGKELAADLNRRFTRVLYSSDPVTEETLRSIQTDLRELRKKIK